MARMCRLAVILVAAALPLAWGRASAASLQLREACGLPVSHIVTCRLSGTGFHPRETLRISYLIVFTSLKPSNGKYPQTVYHRVATTDGTGRFTRPSLSFSVKPYHESFRLQVTVRGTLGDRAATTYVAIAQ